MLLSFAQLIDSKIFKMNYNTREAYQLIPNGYNRAEITLLPSTSILFVDLPLKLIFKEESDEEENEFQRYYCSQQDKYTLFILHNKATVYMELNPNNTTFYSIFGPPFDAKDQLVFQHFSNNPANFTKAHLMIDNPINYDIFFSYAHQPYSLRYELGSNGAVISYYSSNKLITKHLNGSDYLFMEGPITRTMSIVRDNEYNNITHMKIYVNPEMEWKNPTVSFYGSIIWSPSEEKDYGHSTCIYGNSPNTISTKMSHLLIPEKVYRAAFDVEKLDRESINVKYQVDFDPGVFYSLQNESKTEVEDFYEFNLDLFVTYKNCVNFNASRHKIDSETTISLNIETFEKLCEYEKSYTGIIIGVVVAVISIVIIISVIVVCTKNEKCISWRRKTLGEFKAKKNIKLYNLPIIEDDA